MKSDKKKGRGTVVLTGACGLLGKSILVPLLEDGWHVIAVDLLRPRDSYENVDFIQFDLSEIKKYDHLVAEINSLTKNLKALINNAGVNASVEKSFKDFIWFKSQF